MVTQSIPGKWRKSKGKNKTKHKKLPTATNPVTTQELVPEGTVTSDASTVSANFSDGQQSQSPAVSLALTINIKTNQEEGQNQAATVTTTTAGSSAVIPAATPTSAAVPATNDKPHICTSAAAVQPQTTWRKPMLLKSDSQRKQFSGLNWITSRFYKLRQQSAGVIVLFFLVACFGVAVVLQAGSYLTVLTPFI